MRKGCNFRIHLKKGENLPICTKYGKSYFIKHTTPYPAEGILQWKGNLVQAQNLKETSASPAKSEKAPHR